MRRSVLVYRAEDGVSNVFGGATRGITKPVERRPIDSFTINEPDVDKARRIARAFVVKRHGEQPDSVQVLVDGALSVTLPARRS